MKTLLSAATSDGPAEDHRLVSSLPISDMSFGRRALVDAVECPKCGKRSIVERSSNIFDCLNCSFHRELPPVSRRSSPGRSATSLFSKQQRLAAEGEPVTPTSSYPLSAHPLGLRQRSSLNALLSSDVQRSSLDRFSLDVGEEIVEPDKSQPWIFAVIAVIFGILLL